MWGVEISSDCLPRILISRSNERLLYFDFRPRFVVHDGPRKFLDKLLFVYLLDRKTRRSHGIKIRIKVA